MPGMNLGVAHGEIRINTSDLKNADIALRSAGDSMVNMGMKAIGAFAAIVGEAAKFEKEMDFVSAITNASEEEMDKLRDAALKLGKESIFGPVELSQAFVELVKAGASAEQIIDGVGLAAVNLATAADVDIPFAGENLINIMNTYRLGAEDAAHVTDQLAGAANASSVDLQDIVTTMRYAGPVAEALGLSLEETVQALSILGKVGIKGSTAGTSLRFMMTHLIPSTEKASDAMTSLGLTVGEDGLVKEFTAADGSLIGLADAMEILMQKTEGMGEQAKVKVIQDIFGVRAMPSVLELLNLGAEGFANIRAEIERTTALDVATERVDNLDGSLKRLKATWSAIMVEAGGPFQTMVKSWIDGLRDLLLWFDRLPGPFKSAIVGAIGAFGLLSVIAGGFLLTVGNMVRAIRVIAEIGNAFYAIAGGMRAAASANSILSASLLLSPWFWVIAAIIAVIAALVLLWFHCEDFREGVKDLWEDLKRWGQAIADFFVAAWDAVWEFFTSWEEKWRDIKGAVGDAWEAVKGFFSDIWNAITGFVSGVGSWFADVWNGLVDGLSTAAGAVVDFFQELPGIIAGYVSEAAKAIWGLIPSPRQVGYAIGRVLGEIAGAMARFKIRAQKLMQDAIIKVLTLISDLLLDWIPAAVLWAWEFGFALVHGIIDWISQLPGWFVTFFTGIWNFLVTWVPQVVSFLWNFGSTVFSTIWGWIQQIPGIVIGFFTDILNWLIGAVPQFFGAAWDIGTNVWNGIWDVLTGLPQAIWQLFMDAIDLVTGLAQDAWDAGWAFADGLWQGFKDGIKGSPKTKIEYTLMDIEKQAWATEGNLLRSISSMSRSLSAIPLNTGTLGMTTPAMAAAAGGSTTYNGPLVGVAHIRSDQDIVKLARQLDEEKALRERARGRKAS